MNLLFFASPHSLSYHALDAFTKTRVFGDQKSITILLYSLFKFRYLSAKFGYNSEGGPLYFIVGGATVKNSFSQRLVTEKPFTLDISQRAFRHLFQNTQFWEQPICFKLPNPRFYVRRGGTVSVAYEAGFYVLASPHVHRLSCERAPDSVHPTGARFRIIEVGRHSEVPHDKSNKNAIILLLLFVNTRLLGFTNVTKVCHHVLRLVGVREARRKPRKNQPFTNLTIYLSNRRICNIIGK